MSNQEGVHAAVRSYTGTALDYLSDWHALFTTDGIAAGPWNSRMLAWINQSLGTAYSNLNEAKTAFAVSQGFDRWQDMNTFVTGPLIALSGATIAEDAAVGAVIGTLSVINGSGSYTFTITADPDSKFAIDGSDLETGAALDFETATSHSVTIEATNGVAPAISRTFTITVSNVFEQPSLVALSLSASTITEGSAENTSVGSIVGKTTGSALSLINDAGGRFKLSGSAIVAGATATNYATSTTHNITVRETLADSANSPLDTVITITVTQAGVGPTGDGIQLETGDFLLAENGDYLIQEAA